MQKLIEINNEVIKQRVIFINQNISFYNNSLSLAMKKKAKEFFSQREICVAIQKAVNFSIIGNNKHQSEIENARNIPNSYPIKNGINFEKFYGETYNSYLQKSNKILTVADDIQRSLINNNMIN